MDNATWRPVANGEYESQHVADSCIIEGEWLTVQERIVGSDDTEVATISLPPNLRLCERVEDNRPRPDWNDAPEWAMWWTVHSHGLQSWFENEPTVDGHVWNALAGKLLVRGDDGIIEPIEIPIGVDWRLLKEMRPND